AVATARQLGHRLPFPLQRFRGNPRARQSQSRFHRPPRRYARPVGNPHGATHPAIHGATEPPITAQRRPVVMRLLPTLLLALLLSGCSSLLLSMNQHALDDFQSAIDTQHFKKAEQMATNLPASHKDYAAIQKLLPALRQAEQSFADDSLRSARKLAASQQLQPAIDLLAQARLTLPEPPANLEQLQQQLQQQQRQQIDQHQADLLTSEADWLLDQQATLTYLTQQQQNASARQQASALKTRQPQLANELVELGQAFAQRKDWQSSYRCLSLAQQLGAAKLPQDTLKQAQAHLQRTQQQHQRQRREKQQAEADERIARYRKSQLMVDLLAARDYI